MSRISAGCMNISTCCVLPCQGHGKAGHAKDGSLIQRMADLPCLHKSTDSFQATPSLQGSVPVLHGVLWCRARGGQIEIGLTGQSWCGRTLICRFTRSILLSSLLSVSLPLHSLYPNMPAHGSNALPHWLRHSHRMGRQCMSHASTIAHV